MNKRTVKLPPELVTKVRDASTILAIMIAFIILSYYKYDFVITEDGSYDYLPYIPPMQKQWIETLGYIQLVSSLTLLLGFCVNNRSLVVQEGWRVRCE